MWETIKETVTSKYFWIGFCEGFFIIPLFFAKPIYQKLLARDLQNDKR